MKTPLTWGILALEQSAEIFREEGLPRAPVYRVLTPGQAFHRRDFM